MEVSLMPSTAAFTAFVHKENQMWAKIVKDAKVKIDRA